MIEEFWDEKNNYKHGDRVLSFNASHSMDNAWGTFKDAVLGNPKTPRDFMQEIQETQDNTKICPN